MVDVTLIELDLENAEFTAHAPFSGKSGKSTGSKVSKLVGRRSKSGDTGDDSDGGLNVDVRSADEDSTNPALPLAFMAGLVILLVVYRKLRRGPSESEQQELVEYEA